MATGETGGGVLERIMAERRADVESAQRRVPVEKLIEAARGLPRHSLRAALSRAGRTRIVAEIKRASPSAGAIRAGADAGRVAAGYAQAGAAAISVLTEPRHFLGSEDDLRAVRRAVSLPVLRKDFMVSPYQVHEAAAWGADVVLLIAAGLDADTLLELHRTAQGLGLETLVEIHGPGELPAAVACEGAIIGVNSRDLRTLETDLGVARALAPKLPKGRLCIAESGIRSRADVVELERLGYSGFLVGGALMQAADPAARLRELLGWRNESKVP